MIDPWTHLHGDPRPAPLPGDMALAAIIVLASAGVVLLLIWLFWPVSGWVALALMLLMPVVARVTR